ncbi:aldo/keto reductase [Jatrophihabitans telluris]|uniref:Aldo/keto reductase n=1 Tax=Jatrophihabitans telluris TaxID=2038343 RepID=A0ABY4R038_9ACTN|nr:aldo/keto reductase [Jatrophihabitans telluris]UQX89138.1 aldo/keto reductase [Jatrophihabitans telluris]
MTFTSDAISDLPLVLGGNVFGWTADRDASFAVLDAFVAAGGKHIDTADVYSLWVPGNSGGDSEAIIGEWLTSRGNRDALFIATKVGALAPHDNLRPDSIAAAVEDSLRRLNTDYIDLYWAHRDDADTPQEETLAAFDSLVRAGKVRYLGASNFSAERLRSSLAITASSGGARYEAVQPLYNLLEHAEYEDGVGRVAAEHRLATVPYYGLAAGFLTGKYRPGVTVDSARAEGAKKYFDDRGFGVIDALESVATDHDVTVSAVALAWLNQQPTVLAPIASARTAEQFADLASLKGLVLSEDELGLLRKAAS